MNSKKVLITGARGFIGSHLGNMLVEKGFEVVGVDNNSHPCLNTTNFNILNQDAAKTNVKDFDIIFGKLNNHPPEMVVLSFKY